MVGYFVSLTVIEVGKFIVSRILSNPIKASVSNHTDCKEYNKCSGFHVSV